LKQKEIHPKTIPALPGDVIFNINNNNGLNMRNPIMVDLYQPGASPRNSF
jgi:hypothetical protein